MDFVQRFERVLNGEVQGDIVCGDCLDVMAEMPDGCANLIYIDPPFGDNALDRQFGLCWNATKEHLQWLDEYFGRCVQNIRKRRQLAHYLYFIHERLVPIRNLLAEDGSIYVHCDWQVNSHLRLALDEVFGTGNFQREIAFSTGWALGFKTSVDNWIKQHEVLLFYSKDRNSKQFNRQYIDYEVDYEARARQDPDGRLWVDQSLGRITEGKLEEMIRAGKAYRTSTGNWRKKQYLDEMLGRRLGDIWTDINPINSQARERLGYPTQKAEALLERIIKASSNEGDLVADFFCGSGTTLAVAAKLGRRYFGCDINPEAVGLALERLARDYEQRAQKGLGI